jgi:hypothetical protein
MQSLGRNIMACRVLHEEVAHAGSLLCCVAICCALWLISFACMHDVCDGRGFKALKQLVKLYYKHKMYDEMMESYRQVASISGSSKSSSSSSSSSRNQHE